MAEVDGQQKASDACGGRVSHERGWRTRGQDVPGPINCTRRSPSSLSRPAIFLSLLPSILFLYRNRCFPCDRFSVIDYPNTEPKSVFPRETRDHLTLVMCIDLYFTPLIIPILAFLRSISAISSSCCYNFVTDVYF